MEQMNTYKRFEVTIIDEELWEGEQDIVKLIAAMNDINVAISKSGRIITLDNVETIYDCIKIIAKFGLAEEVGLIREITDYEPNLEVLLDE